MKNKTKLQAMMEIGSPEKICSGGGNFSQKVVMTLCTRLTLLGMGGPFQPSQQQQQLKRLILLNKHVFNLATFG